MKTRGAITLVFDDGYQQVYEQVLPLLRKYAVRAVFAVPLRVPGTRIAKEALKDYQDWLAATAHDGHEVAAHGVTHNSFTSLSDIQLTQELLEPAETLRTSTLIYPGGAHDNRVVHSAQRYYKAARTVLHGLNKLAPEDPFRLRTINFTKRNFSVARANIRALQALLQNKWLIETYHMVSKEESGLTHSARIDDLDAHLDFITSLPIRIATIEEIL